MMRKGGKGRGKRYEGSGKSRREMRPVMEMRGPDNVPLQADWAP